MHVSDGNTRLIGLFASPIRHSSSPRMQNLAFLKCGINMQYLAFEVNEEHLQEAVNAIRILDMPGANISMPNKIRVIEYLDALSEEAYLIGAVNTIVNTDGRLTGYNTDGLGYVAALRKEGIVLEESTLTLVGAGGAATAIAITAALSGLKKLYIFNAKDSFYANAMKTKQKIEENTDTVVAVQDLADDEALKEAIACSNILTNATNMGMKPLLKQTWLKDASYLHRDLLVTDTVYAPEETLFLHMAKEAGCRVRNGYGMMLYQGAEAFRLWTGMEMPAEEIGGEMGIL